MVKQRSFNPHAFHYQLKSKLLSLAAISVNYEQLSILADIADLFCYNVEPEYRYLYEGFEKKAVELRDQLRAVPND